MKISAIGDPYLYWPEWILDAPLDAFPTGKWLGAFPKWGPCRKQKFVVLMVGYEIDPVICYCLAVEYEAGDKQVAELAHGGGISWTNYFLQYDKLMMITSRWGPGSTSTLVDTSIYEKQIRVSLDPFGNTGAWEIYHRFANSGIAMLTPETHEFNRQAILEVWNKYTLDCEQWFSDKKIAAA